MIQDLTKVTPYSGFNTWGDAEEQLEWLGEKVREVGMMLGWPDQPKLPNYTDQRVAELAPERQGFMKADQRLA